MNQILLPFKKLIIPFRVDELMPNILILIPRVLTGYLLSFVFAVNKFGTPWTPKSMELQLFEVSDWFVKLVLNTRITAFFITITMFITIAFRPWDGSWNIIPTFIFFCIGIFCMGFGSGKFGLDYLFTRRKPF